MATRRRREYERVGVAMDTIVHLRVESDGPSSAVAKAFDRALSWFQHVEESCNRFDERSELSRLCTRVGASVPVSPLLAQALAFSLDVARLTNGAFDPTVGAVQLARGFDRNYRTQERIGPGAQPSATYRDVDVDIERGTVTLRRPLLLDLGGVAKGLA